MTIPATSTYYRTPDVAESEAYGAMSIDDLMAGYHEIADEHTKQAYRDAEEYYEGTRPEFFAEQRYRNALMRTGTTFRLNYAKTPVEARVDRLEINGIHSGDSNSVAILEAFWEENQMDLEATEIHRRACEFGDAYLLVWPDEGADEEFDDDQAQSALDDSSDDSVVGIEAYYNDPRVMRLFYDPENPRRKHYAMKMWKIRKGEDVSYMRANLYYKDRIEKYVTNKNGKGDQASEWSRHMDDDDLSWPLANPYGQVPVFHFRTDRPYGTPVHKEAYGPQDVITKLVITHMNTIDYHGFPQRWAIAGNDLGEGDDDTEDFAFEDDTSGDADALAGAGSERSALKAKPGHVWFLKNIKSVGQFDAAPSNTFMDPMVIYIRAMAQVTRTPVHKFDFQGNPPSGESLRVSEQPFVKNIRNLQMGFGATWNDMCEFVLKIFKIDGRKYKIPALNVPDAASGNATGTQDAPQTDVLGPPGKVTISWASPAAKDDQLSWDLAILKIDAGVPRRQVFLEAGYTKKQLDAWGVPASKWIEPPPPPAAATPSKLPEPRNNPLLPPGGIN